MPPQQLMVFLKAPRPGLVKTRLAAALGLEAAASAYRMLAAAVLKAIAPEPGVELRFTPDDAFGEINPWLRPGWDARPQGPGDLGARLQRAFEEAFAGGAQQAVAIGTDCPFITSEDLRAAWQALAAHDLVLGPACDGGYWLIGLNRPHPHLFETIHWSTSSVLEQTLERARRDLLRVHLLRTLPDIDTEADWRDYLDRME